MNICHVFLACSVCLAMEELKKGLVSVWNKQSNMYKLRSKGRPNPDKDLVVSFGWKWTI